MIRPAPLAGLLASRRPSQSARIPACNQAAYRGKFFAIRGKNCLQWPEPAITLVVLLGNLLDFTLERAASWDGLGWPSRTADGLRSPSYVGDTLRGVQPSRKTA